MRVFRAFNREKREISQPVELHDDAHTEKKKLRLEFTTRKWETLR